MSDFKQGDMVRCTSKSGLWEVSGKFGKFIRDHSNGMDVYVDFGTGEYLIFSGLIEKA